MPDLIPVLDNNAIAEKVGKIARQISSDYTDSDLVLICVLKGAFVFMADLLRRLELEPDRIKVDFVRLTSYGGASQTSGKIGLMLDFQVDIQDKDVLIIEDIIDSGLTLSFLKNHLKAANPRSVRSCVLIDKKERRQTDVQAEYICHTVEEGFLVGYGLDYAEAYRNLPGIFTLNL